MDLSLYCLDLNGTKGPSSMFIVYCQAKTSISIGCHCLSNNEMLDTLNFKQINKKV